jgi:hypothetical protein
MSLLNLGRDVSGRTTFLRSKADHIYNGVLTSLGGEQTITIPSDAKYWDVIFAVTPGASIWIAINQTAVVPSSSIATGTSELNPVGYSRLLAGDVIHFITGDTSNDVSIALYPSP